jgi:nicotinamidase-related amidase
MNSSSHINNNSKPALIIVDLINSFSFKHGCILAEKTEKMIQNINLLRKQFIERELPIIYVNDYYKIKNPTADKLIKHCLNPLSYNVIKEIKPNEKEFFVFKPNYSGFYKTILDNLLKELKITLLIIIGVAGNRCVLFTANDAFMRDYNLIIPSDAISSVSDYDEKIAMYMMKDILNAKVILSQEIEGILDNLFIK